MFTSSCKFEKILLRVCCSFCFLGWAIAASERDWKYRLSIYYAKIQDSGTYTCSTPRGLANSIRVHVVGEYIFHSRDFYPPMTPQTCPNTQWISFRLSLNELHFFFQPETKVLRGKIYDSATSFMRFRSPINFDPNRFSNRWETRTRVISTRRENNNWNYYSVIVTWYHVAPLKDFTRDIVISHLYSIVNSRKFDIFRQIFIFSPILDEKLLHICWNLWEIKNYYGIIVPCCDLRDFSKDSHFPFIFHRK